MTDKEKLEAIKAEIERWKNELFLNASFNECKQFILNKLQKFIVSLDEQSEEKLKEFNVDEYHKNPERKIVTRDGREVEILKIDTKTKTNVPVIAMMDGNDIRFFTTNGRLSLERETCSDLFFADDNCDTCTNDKGCVACENGELYEGKPTDYTKSNEEKAKEICNHGIPTCDLKCESCNIAYHVDGLIQMAEWKDEQFKAEKQALIDKAVKYLAPIAYTHKHLINLDDFIEYMKGKAMKGGEK